MSNDTSDYDELINQIEPGIKQAGEKLESGRINDPEREQARINYLNELNSLLRTKLDVLEARDSYREEYQIRSDARRAARDYLDTYDSELIDLLNDVVDGNVSND